MIDIGARGQFRGRGVLDSGADTHTVHHNRICSNHFQTLEPIWCIRFPEFPEPRKRDPIWCMRLLLSAQAINGKPPVYRDTTPHYRWPRLCIAVATKEQLTEISHHAPTPKNEPLEAICCRIAAGWQSCSWITAVFACRSGTSAHQSRCAALTIRNHGDQRNHTERHGADAD